MHHEEYCGDYLRDQPWQPNCNDCGAEIAWYPTEQEAVSAWNTRKPDVQAAIVCNCLNCPALGDLQAQLSQANERVAMLDSINVALINDNSRLLAAVKEPDNG